MAVWPIQLGIVQESEPTDIHVVQVRSHVELITVEGCGHGLPLGGDRCDDLPMILVAYLDGHGESRLVGLPAIRHGVSLWIKPQLERWNGCMTEILVEDRGQVAPAVLA